MVAMVPSQMERSKSRRPRTDQFPLYLLQGERVVGGSGGVNVDGRRREYLPWSNTRLVNPNKNGV